MTEYTFHRGIPVLIPSPDGTPIHDALKREYAEAAVKAATKDPEGIRLVQNIHLAKGWEQSAARLEERIAASVHRPSSVVKFLGLFS